MLNIAEYETHVRMSIMAALDVLYFYFKQQKHALILICAIRAVTLEINVLAYKRDGNAAVEKSTVDRFSSKSKPIFTVVDSSNLHGQQNFLPSAFRGIHRLSHTVNSRDSLLEFDTPINHQSIDEQLHNNFNSNSQSYRNNIYFNAKRQNFLQGAVSSSVLPLGKSMLTPAIRQRNIRKILLANRKVANEPDSKPSSSPSVAESRKLIRRASGYMEYYKMFGKVVDDMKIIKHRNGQGGCDEFSTDYSPCTASCGLGTKLKLSVAIQKRTCVSSWDVRQCLSMEACKTTAEINAIPFHGKRPKSIPLAVWNSEQLVPNSGNWNEQILNNEICLAFEGSATKRDYDVQSGSAKHCGNLFKFRITRSIVNDNVGKPSCTLTIHKEPSGSPCPMDLRTFQNLMTNSMNFLRTSVGLGTVKWNPAIAHKMKIHLMYLSNENDCQLQHSSKIQRTEVFGFKYLGENLYQECTNIVPQDVNQSWWSEAACYMYTPIGHPCSTKVNENCSYEDHAEGVMVHHFTQVAWHSTEQFGCAFHHCPNKCKNGFHSLLVGCMYAPGGNIRTQYPFSKSVAQALQETYPYVLHPDDRNEEQCKAEQEKFKKLNPRRNVDFQ